jgi:hypothetical protein
VYAILRVLSIGMKSVKTKSETPLTLCTDRSARRVVGMGAFNSTRGLMGSSSK